MLSYIRHCHCNRQCFYYASNRKPWFLSIVGPWADYWGKLLARVTSEVQTTGPWAHFWGFFPWTRPGADFRVGAFTGIAGIPTSLSWKMSRNTTPWILACYASTLTKNCPLPIPSLVAQTKVNIYWYEMFWVRVVSLVSLIECVPRYPGGRSPDLPTTSTWL